MENRLIIKDATRTALYTLLLLLFFFLQGFAVIAGHIEGAKQFFVQGSIIWVCAVTAMYISCMRERKLSKIGCKLAERGSAKTILFYIPFVIVAMLPFLAGVDFSNPLKLVIRLYMTIAIGFAEEIVFRGIIFKTWLNYGLAKAVIISSTLFALCHFMNVLGGASILATVLQICFAFSWGIAISFVFYFTKSIWPGIILHAFHDFCSFISNECSDSMNIVIGAIQFGLLVITIVYFIIRARKS